MLQWGLCFIHFWKDIPVFASLYADSDNVIINLLLKKIWQREYTLLKKIKGTWSAPSLVCGHSQVQLLEDMHNCTSLKSVMFKKQLTLLAMSLTQPWHLIKG